MGKDKTWRKTCKDGTFVEGVRHSGEHLHYDSREGSDILVNWRDEKTGQGVNLRKEPLNKIGGGKKAMGKKTQLGRSLGDVRKGTQDGITDIGKKRDESEKRVSDLEMIIDKMSDVRGGVNQESIDTMKREIEEAVREQRQEFEKAADEVEKKEKNLEERVETLGEGIADTEADAKDARSLLKTLKTDFVKKHLSKLEQESKSEGSDYKEQKKSLDSTIKEVSKQIKDQERRAKKVAKFSKI